MTAGRDYRDVTVTYRLGTRVTDAAEGAPHGGRDPGQEENG
ncbi:hypothetical protein [Streptomyces griseosporeus]